MPEEQPAQNNGLSTEAINLHLIGSRKAVKREIQILHALGHINASEWSRPVPFKNQEKVICVTTRYISLD